MTIARSKSIWMFALSLLMLALLVLPSTARASTRVCIHFDDLVPETEYPVGSTITSAGYELQVRPFQLGDGTLATDGLAIARNSSEAGGSGHELQIANVNVSLDISATLDVDAVDGIQVRFAELGGNVNLAINGDLRNAQQFRDFDGMTIGGAVVSVNSSANQFNNERGLLVVDGKVSSFAIGGQELFIDEMCPIHNPEGRPDLGDAPDSTNHHGIVNLAYPADGTPGRFPTVWEDPTGAPSGPKHLNQTPQAWLGHSITAEREADIGADSDGVNNILNGGVDNADNDLRDDGWRNRNVALDDCRRTTLRVRVSRHAASTLDTMYLNVWFDGNRDGDWQDGGICKFDNLAAHSFEWIVQNEPVTLAAIPAGGFVDLAVTTHLVYNEAPNRNHWMRFTLSERPAPTGTDEQQPNDAQPAKRLPDGRGPRAQDAYRAGETEDLLQHRDLTGEPGRLVLEKEVRPHGDVAHAGSLVDYLIRLKHEGGSAPATTTLEDVLPAGIALASRIHVQEVQPSVSPLHVKYENRTLHWRGELAPAGQLEISFVGRVLPCFGEPKVITNRVKAQQTDGSTIGAEATFEARCISVSAEDFTIRREVVSEHATDLPDPEIGAAMTDIPSTEVIGGPVIVRTLIEYHGEEPQITLNVADLIRTMRVADEANAAASGEDPEGEDPEGAANHHLLTFAPGETHRFETVIQLPEVDDTVLTQSLTVESKLLLCLHLDDVTRCPEPNDSSLSWHAGHLHIHLRAHDLGDAPDSSNHFGVAMEAYAGVQAEFPTVFDPALGLPQGPRHRHVRHLHLGERVSREVEADLGPDGDLINNIVPIANTPNLDRHDDGVRPALWNAVHCRRMQLDVQVTISPRAANFFAETERTAYLNMWLDANRDGDWADAADCDVDGADPYALEHFVIDYPVDAAALGAGTHVLSVTTNRVPWPAGATDKPAWARVTLSERESNKTLQSFGVAHGDGRGYNQPFLLGETEDYRVRPQRGPDMAIQKRGRIQQAFDTDAGTVDTRIAWQISYRNEGGATAQNVVIRDKLGNGQDISALLLDVESSPLLLHEVENGEIVFRVGDVEAGAGGTIVIITKQSGELAAARTIVNQATVRADVDTDPSNNLAEASVQVGVRAPRFISPVDGTTCSEAVDVIGRADPGAEVQLYVDGALEVVVPADENGMWSVSVELDAGMHTLYAIAQIGGVDSDPSATIMLTVDPTLLYDPISLTFEDEKGRVTRPKDEDGRTDADGWILRLRPNMTYLISIEICCEEGQGAVTIDFGDAGIVVLEDPDGDGVFTGTFVTGRRNQVPTAMAITVECGDEEVIYTGDVVLIDPEGVVYDVLTGQPLDASTVACMAYETSAAENGALSTLTLWNAEDFGQVNPQSTAADGYFSFFTPVGSYQLNVNRAEYQPYQSAQIDVVSEAVRYDVPLTPVIADAADYVIEISDAGFNPSVLTVEPGAVIEWVNLDAGVHSTTSTDPALSYPDAVGNGGWDSGLLSPGAGYKFRVGAEGTYAYADRSNSSLAGTLIVQADDPGPGAGSDHLIFVPVITYR